MAQEIMQDMQRRGGLRQLLALSSQIALIQVGMMLMGVVDTLMVGHLSSTALAAVALGSLYVFGVMAFGMGTLLALDPIVAQAVGAGDEPSVQRGLQRGMLLSLLLAVPTSLALLAVGPMLRSAGQPADVIPVAVAYVYHSIPGVWPFLLFVVLRQTLQARHHTRPIVATIVLANIVNTFLNYAWIFGEFGFPAMGVVGSAWATTVGRWSMALLLLWFGWPMLRAYLRSLAPGLCAPGALLQMLRLGVPIGGQMFLEWSAFGAVALLMGRLGTTQVAAHQIAVNLASLTFMVPLGVASAAAVVVGNAVGRGDPEGVRRASRQALGIGASFMVLAAAAFIGFPSQLAGLYTREFGVLALAGALLPLAGLFQVFDGIQVVSMGLLRGLGDTRVPMAIHMLGFWGVGMPIGAWLGFRTGFGAPGLWWGLVVGLGVVAAFLLLRVKHFEGRDLERLRVDAA
jgi:MATE family multidrug resistance protein